MDHAKAIAALDAAFAAHVEKMFGVLVAGLIDSGNGKAAAAEAEQAFARGLGLSLHAYAIAETEIERAALG